MRRFQPIDIIGVVLIAALLITAIRIIGDHLVSPEEEVVGAVVEAPAEPEMAAEPEAVAEPEAAPEIAAEPEMAAEAEEPKEPEMAMEEPEMPMEPEMAAEPEAVEPEAAEPEAVAEAAPAPGEAAETEEAAEETSVAALAAGDPEAGEGVFKKHLCFGCHKFEPGQHGAGPSLAGFFGREAAKAEGFSYSKALQDSGIVWTPENLDRWVTDPKAMVKGTKMLLPKPVKDAEDRADLIAYLKEATSK